jgi:hypothetical protein
MRWIEHAHRQLLSGSPGNPRAQHPFLEGHAHVNIFGVSAPH